MTDHPVYRIHLIGLAHLPTRREYSSCAYTNKLLKAAKMLKSLGHHVIFYGVEGSDVECDEFVQVSTKDILNQTYGDYDWTKEFFKREWGDLAHAVFNMNCVKEINKRKKSDDFLFLSMGVDQEPIAKGVNLHLTVEYGIGYDGIFASFKVFESYAWMHYMYGKLRFVEGNWFDAVIPNYFDPADFEFREKKGDYFLFIGRIIRRKGVQLAQEVCEKLGARLIIAGQEGNEKLAGSPDLSRYGEFVGHADPEKRKELMAGARAVFCPTSYVEPFAGVQIEAMMSGTPVISTDWGVFNETNLDHITGYRVRTFSEAVWAAQNVDSLDKKKIRKWAEDNFSMDRVRWLYQAYLEHIYSLHKGTEAGDVQSVWYDENSRGTSVYHRYYKSYPHEEN